VNPTKFNLFVILLVVISAFTPLTLHNQNPQPPGNHSESTTLDQLTFIPLIIQDNSQITPSPNPSETPPDPSETPQPWITPSTTPSSTPSPTTDPTVTPSPTPYPPDFMVVDHTSIALFDQIPEEYLTAARNLNMLFSDRSVGQNIHEYLDCLDSATDWGNAPSTCRRDYYDDQWNWKVFTQADLDQGLVPERIIFDPDPVLYDRSNWTYEFRMGTWSQLTENFITSLAPAYLDTKDVLSYQFSYLNVLEGDNISDPETGFFADTAGYDVHDLEAFIAQHPDKIFIFWTTSLARGIGSQVATDFNNQMRQYAVDHDKILFDVADIEAHTDLGIACYDNRDGVEYCNSVTGECENYPNDGVNLPAICQDWTTEVDGGHLGSVSGGGLALAKAYWVLMARIAGWVP